ncbi:hypothetical protein [Plantactinospora sp. GCM10030261]|uniref:hypothetical protein n=1 Tax=Plantactinospora sp. GCM10030261 TaxID=3273420 RepID=UPI003609F565
MTMRRRTLALLAIVTGLAVGPLTAAPAQANTAANCMYHQTIGNVDLEVKVCASGGNDVMDSTIWVYNKASNNAHYVQFLNIWTDMGGYNTCYIGWLNPKNTRLCSALTVQYREVPMSQRAFGEIRYYAPAAGEYRTIIGPSQPVLVF